MYGALFGDYVGSIYEWHNIKTKDFPLGSRGCQFTDDSSMTIAVAQACNNWEEHRDLAAFQEDVQFEMIRIGLTYPNKGYGGRFRRWLNSDHPYPYGSYGNGSAMRVSPCGLAARSLSEALDLAKASAMPTHNHPEGIKGAQAVAVAVYLAYNDCPKEAIREAIHEYFYPLDKTLDEIRPDYEFDETCQGSVPQAIEAFLESANFEDAIRNAVSIGGDSDTIAAITGSIAEAYYGMPHAFNRKTRYEVERLCYREEQDIVARFRHRFCKQLYIGDKHGEDPRKETGK